MEGAKYDPKRSTNDIAKAIRADIKAALSRPPGDPWGLPKGLKVSVRLDKFAGGCSINARITAFPGPLLNPAREVWRRLFPHQPLRHSPLTREAARVVAVLEAFLAAYNFDKSDPQSDYFNVRFYGDAEVHWEYAAQRGAELLAEPALAELVADLAVAVAGRDVATAERTIATLDEGYDSVSEERELRALLCAKRAEAA